MSPISEFTYACRASLGARDFQEDSGLVWRPLGVSGHCRPILAVLADGMGGHVSGETASRLACDHFIQTFSADRQGPPAQLERSLLASNEALAAAISKNGALKGMGCTLVAGYLDEEGLRWVSVGDTALLLYREGTLRRLNADHSVGAMLNRQVEAGLLAPEDAQNDPRRRALRSALTGSDIPLKDYEFKAYPLSLGDWVILATDGLEVLSGDEIASLIQKYEESTPDMVASSLLAAVEQKRAQYQDNTTVIVLKVAASSAQPERLIDRLAADANLPETLLVKPRDGSEESTDPPSGSGNSFGLTATKKSWLPGMKFALLGLFLLGAAIAIGIGAGVSSLPKEAGAPSPGR